MEWTVPGVGDCTIKVTESAYDEARKKGKYQRLYFACAACMAGWRNW